MNDKGNDIAVWTLLNRLPPTYFQLSDRQYFRDIKYKRGYALPDDALRRNESVNDKPINNTSDSFTIQPVLSRFTGEYTINIVKRSLDTLLTNSDTLLINKNITNSQNKKALERISNKTAIAVGLSGQLYSVWNTVVPKGFAFCIVDESGTYICHSDTARSLQENIFEESGDSLAIRNVINHKDSTLLSDIILYEQPVKMLIKPLPGLPYYLITYCTERSEYLFMLHVVAFTVVCISTLLLFASLFSYCMMMSGKRATKLLFIPADLNWIKPSADKKHYYVKIIYQCLASAGLTLLFAGFYRLFYDAEEYYLFSVNAALLLPLFIITGYYVVKKSRDFVVNEKIETAIFSRKQYLKFLVFIERILILYVVSVLLFAVLQNVLFFNKTCTNGYAVKFGIWTLIVLVLSLTIVIAGLNPAYTKSSTTQQTTKHYLTCYVVALLLVTILMSVIPSINFISYAFREEKTLQLQSFQIDLAKKIQQRRTSLNSLFWKTKLSINPFRDTATEYINNLKFSTSEGIYLLNNDSLHAQHFDNPPPDTVCSPFYKSMTQYLFLPPDHDEFYDNASHNKYYYWTGSINRKNVVDTLRLHYNNTTDNRYDSSFTLTSTFCHTYLFKDFTDNYLGWLALLVLIIFAFLFYRTIYSISKRVFLIDFFKPTTIQGNENKIVTMEDAVWLQKTYDCASLKEACKDIFTNDKSINFATIRKIENEAMLQENGEEIIIQFHLVIKDVYEDIWKACSDVEKYTLYDYATDGFTNYKQVLVLYDLYRKGLLVKEEDGNIALMTKSFRNFLITKQGSEEVKRMSSESKKGSWSTLRTVFYVVLFAVAIFIFISQEEASKRLITIVTSLGALLPAILKLFDKGTFSMQAADKSSDK